MQVQQSRICGKWQPKIIIYPRFLPRIALRGNFDEDQSVSALLSAT
jgi:hypothetical protein